MRAARIAVLAGLVLVATNLHAQQVGRTITKRGTIAEDLYLAGGTIDVRADLRGDVVAAGGRILIEQRVAGDVIAAGGSVEVGAEVLDDVRAAGGTVTLRGAITGDAVATGGTVELRPDATVGGRAWFGGGTVDVGGRIATHMKAAAEKIVISGVIEGDATITANEIEILPTARIAGTLTYRSPREARIAPGAQVGGVTRLPYEQPSLAAKLVSAVLAIAGLGLIGAVLIAVFPAFTMGALRTLGREPGRSLGLGALLLVAVPIAAVLMMITVVGIGLGVAGFVLYGLALLAGYLIGALSVGDAVIGLITPRVERTAGAWIGALLLGLTVLSLLRLIPVIGAVICFGAVLAGLGALSMHAYRAWKRWRAGSGAVEAAA